VTLAFSGLSIPGIAHWLPDVGGPLGQELPDAPPLPADPPTPFGPEASVTLPLHPSTTDIERMVTTRIATSIQEPETSAEQAQSWRNMRLIAHLPVVA